MAGTVRATNYDLFGYGNHVIVMHEEGYESLYAHMSEIEVKPGQEVKNETVIGGVGSTGLSTGPHLHLEVRQEGQLLNPAELVPGVK
jgi:murein DD-endopeptidase MepM/ murein hydrolase activator NlpD